jgi:hypothetical protein
VEIDNRPVLTYFADDLPESFQRSFPDFQNPELRFDQFLQYGRGLFACEGKGAPEKEMGQNKRQARNKNYFFHVFKQSQNVPLIAT